MRQGLTKGNTIMKRLTVGEAQNLLREYGMVLTSNEGEYRVNYRHGAESTAYYTDDLDDALNTGIMAAIFLNAKQEARQQRLLEKQVAS